MIFQGSALFDSLTVEENVRFPLDMFSTLSFADRREKARRCLRRVNLDNADNLYPAQISGGMQKRVNLARAMATAPELLIMDEPFNPLDELLAQCCWNQILHWQKETHAAILAVSHNLTLFQDARIVPLR